ncbi:hypothetical protein JCM24511_02246 [Saitozyma sp. JCM 24511]|nr:hypothetical protein JCM24511_02246 [Saitozyma sp. JCM 24511]
MSGHDEEQHPDLERFYAQLVSGGDEDDPDWVDEDDDDADDDAAYEVYFDPDDMDDEDDDEFMEDDEDDDDAGLDDGEDDEDMGNATALGDQITLEFDPNDESSGRTFLELASLLNSAGGSADARSSLLARLLAGPRDTGPATRSGSQGLLRRLGLGGMSAEERERQARAEAERRRKEKWWKPQTEPNPRGVELLKSGEFGRVGDWRSGGGRHRVRSRAGDVKRSHGYIPPMSAATIPNTNGTVVASYPSIPYVGQYAKEDYSVFFSATQYFTLHLYDVAHSRITPKRPRPSLSPTTSPRATARGQMPGTLGDMVMGEEEDEDEDMDMPWGSWTTGRRGMAREETSLKMIKTVQGEEGRWTVTDADSSRNGDRIIYSSITPYVHMFYTSEHDSEHVCLDFSGSRRRSEDIWGYDSFGIWSIRFSADGKEVIAGAGSGKIMVYDIDAQRRSLSISGHADDVNAVCFADESSTNILVSGSDDGYVKVWDRRSLSSSTPSGILVGATEGITYTSPKGDGRYIVVNSKDQAARLYDLRKMRSWNEFESEPDAVARYGQPRYDYRNSRYPPPARLAHPKDCSIMTYRGHAVLRTLIRCHFSPRESTGQSYIYSGSADGMIHIWSLDGRVVQVLDRSKSVPLRGPNGQFNDPSAPETQRRASQTAGNYDMYYASDSNVVRDVSWHGYEPTLMSTSWSINGGARRGGTIAKHEWKGLGKGGLRKLEDWVGKAQEECAEGEV